MQCNCVIVQIVVLSKATCQVNVIQCSNGSTYVPSTLEALQIHCNTVLDACVQKCAQLQYFLLFFRFSETIVCCYYCFIGLIVYLYDLCFITLHV